MVRVEVEIEVDYLKFTKKKMLELLSNHPCYGFLQKQKKQFLSMVMEETAIYEFYRDPPVFVDQINSIQGDQ